MSTIFTDCLNVYDYVSLSWVNQRSHKRMYSGCAQFGRQNLPIVDVRKVKAHLDVSEATCADDKFMRIGNNLVDASAKVAARSHPKPDDQKMTILDQNIAVARAVGVLAAKLLPLWPALRLEEGVERTKPPARERPDVVPHR